MYRVVLGLEVLGNPVGFVKGLKEGAVGLFYHPIQVKQNLTAAQDRTYHIYIGHAICLALVQPIDMQYNRACFSVGLL